MIEHCCACGTKITYFGDPQYVECPKCGVLNFRYTWKMSMSPEEIATENLLKYVDPWFPEGRWND